MSELWGVKKTAMIVVPVTILGALVVFALLPHDEALKVSKAKGGECIIVPTSPVVKVLQKRDCDRSHDGEVYAKFEYPGTVAAGEPTPDENCRRIPDGLTAEEQGVYERALELLAANALRLVSNNPDPTKKRDYVCIVTFPERTGSYLEEVAAAAQGTAGG